MVHLDRRGSAHRKVLQVHLRRNRLNSMEDIQVRLMRRWVNKAMIQSFHYWMMLNDFRMVYFRIYFRDLKSVLMMETWIGADVMMTS